MIPAALIHLIKKNNLFKLSDTFEMGLSDHHNLPSTILKSGWFKEKPKRKTKTKNLKWKYIDHIGNLTPKVLKKILNLNRMI